MVLPASARLWDVQRLRNGLKRFSVFPAVSRAAFVQEETLNTQSRSIGLSLFITVESIIISKFVHFDRICTKPRAPLSTRNGSQSEGDNGKRKTALQRKKKVLRIYTLQSVQRKQNKENNKRRLSHPLRHLQRMIHSL